TVTDERATRYFMTIPEAVQLILQASVLEDLRGHVAMLDMGEPVRIMDLARDLLRLSGHPYRPGVNVVVTGLRPGEKLHEELTAPGETVVRTRLERVFKVQMSNGFAKLPPDLAEALRSGDLPLIEQRVLNGLRARVDGAAAATTR
ncbi:MAG TPA: polysaccharide biosynthesis protein, partial [Longimicrobiales bacterium]|nr:polysaccharide biosynthesis protein [Longimicrobiales bacterium]